MNNVYCTKRNNDAQLKLLATRSKLGGRLNRVFQIMKKADFNTLFAADEQQDDQWSVLWGSAAADPHTPTHPYT